MGFFRKESCLVVDSARGGLGRCTRAGPGSLEGPSAEMIDPRTEIEALFKVTAEFTLASNFNGSTCALNSSVSEGIPRAYAIVARSLRRGL